MNGMARHTPRPIGLTQDWISPRALIECVGPFDLDPCMSLTQPWPTAARGFTVKDDGLHREWGGVVWMNPPYDRRVIAQWMDRLASHGQGMALIFARTETSWFQAHVWRRASAIYFLAGRLYFYTPQGVRATFNAGAPSCLVAYGYGCSERLRTLERVPRGWPGVFVPLLREAA